MRETAGQAGDGTSPWARSAVCILLLAALSAYFFRGVWNPLNTIDGADSSLWVPMFVHKWTAGLFAPRWAPHYLAGIAQQHLFLSHDLLLALALPPHRFHGFQFMLDTFLAGAFMFAFLRSRRIGRFGSLVGGLSYQLGNNLLTTASLGGMWKFSTACWAPLFLLFFFRVIDGAPNRLRNSVFAGATLGLQFLGSEVQLAYYVCLLALAYFAVEAMSNLWNARRERAFYAPLKAEGKRMLWGALCAVLGIVFAAEVFCSYASFARGNENVGVGSAEENWKFVTEFSFPPEETLALALTGGVFGTDAYPRTYQGRPIKRISDDYIGIVVLMFAFLALFSGGRRAWFFAGAAVIALVISYGRYFPPPVPPGIRAPGDDRPQGSAQVALYHDPLRSGARGHGGRLLDKGAVREKPENHRRHADFLCGHARARLRLARHGGGFNAPAHPGGHREGGRAGPGVGGMCAGKKRGHRKKKGHRRGGAADCSCPARRRPDRERIEIHQLLQSSSEVQQRPPRSVDAHRAGPFSREAVVGKPSS